MSYDFAALSPNTCRACGNLLAGKRFGALTCSARCRKRLSRQAQAIAKVQEALKPKPKRKSKLTSKKKARAKK